MEILFHIRGTTKGITLSSHIMFNGRQTAAKTMEMAIIGRPPQNDLIKARPSTFVLFYDYFLFEKNFFLCIYARDSLDRMRMMLSNPGNYH